MTQPLLAEDSESASDIDLLKHLHEWERKNYWDAVNVFSKAMTFYLAIAAAVLGYLLTRDLPPPFPRDIAWAGLIISVAFLVALVTGVIGVLRQLDRLRQLDVAVTGALQRVQVGPGMHADWRQVVVVMATCSTVLIFVIMIGLALILLGRGH